MDYNCLMTTDTSPLEIFGSFSGEDSGSVFRHFPSAVIGLSTSSVERPR
jgi:hypothetical protein